MTSSEARPHAAVVDLVEVMDRLRSPGGCPWDAQQTHASLVRYVVEEAHELAEAIEAGDRSHLREELGDVLLQVVFHARIAQEDPVDPFDLDEVAAGIAAKLRRRHPHVFADGTATTADEVRASWEELKAAEKPERTGPLDGVPVTMPPLEKATAYASRLERPDLLAEAERVAAGDDLGARLFSLVLEARHTGLDPSAALRATLRTLAERVADPSDGD